MNDVIAQNFTHLFSSLRASTVQQLYVLWFGLGSYRDKDAGRWFDLSLPIVQAAQETSAQATVTYMQLQLQKEGLNDQVYVPPMTEITGPALRNGVPLEEVYGRPFKEVWSGLSAGKNINDAVKDGANRLRQLVETDIQLAHTHTSRAIISRRKDLYGFRRVPTGSWTCALCMLASTQRYHKRNLLPIHPGCDCRVAPLRSKTDQVIDQEGWSKVHDAVARQFGNAAADGKRIDYRKILLVQDHGEYGPTLTVAKHKFTGPDALSRKTPEGSWSNDFTGFENLALR